MLSPRGPSLLNRLWLTTLRPASSTPHAAVMSQSLSASTAAGGRSALRVPGPVETSIQSKPSLIRISNDSSKHSHHAPMRAIGGGSGETHFAVAMVSEAFAGKSLVARHRLVNSLLKDEFENSGLHALSLRLKTPEEWEREEARVAAA